MSFFEFLVNTSRDTKYIFGTSECVCPRNLPWCLDDRKSSLQMNLFSSSIYNSSPVDNSFRQAMHLKQFRWNTFDRARRTKSDGRIPCWQPAHLVPNFLKKSFSFSFCKTQEEKEKEEQLGWGRFCQFGHSCFPIFASAFYETEWFAGEKK